jgi:GTPase SAR1 family protein
MNPFAQPGSASPLCPWEKAHHENFYADIDNSAKSFADFQDKIEHLDPSEVSYAVLVYGKAGCGKSALINRSAHWIRSQFQAQYPNIAVVNLAGEDAQIGVPVDRKLRTQAQLISEKLYAGRAIEKPEFEALKARVDEPAWFASSLQESLLKNHILTVLILPQIELRGELDAYQSTWRRRHLVCFYETTSDDVATHSVRSYGAASAKPTLRLDVGPLRPEDGWTFVAVRLKVAKNAAGSATFPTITRDVIEDYMKARSGSETSIRELHMTCYSVFELARKAKKQVISLNDFAMYWMQVGQVLR